MHIFIQMPKKKKKGGTTVMQNQPIPQQILLLELYQSS